jgi:EpsI family protein
VNQTYLRSRDSRDQRLLVWHWYRIGADHIANPYVAKLIEAKWKLLSGRRDGAGLIIYAEYATKSEEAVPVLREFLSDMLPAIEASLHEAF